MAGGGGGATSTTQAGVPDWAQPYLEKGAQEAFSLYESGQLQNVAGQVGDQTAAQQQIRDQAAGAGTGQAFDTANQVYGDAATGQGVFGAGAYGDVAGQLQPQIDQQVTRALGQQQGQFGRTGNLGGARAQAASASSAGQIASDIAGREVAAQRQGALSGAGAGLQAQQQSAVQQGAASQALAASGQAQQQQSQNEADAAYQGVQRLFGLINPNTVGQQSTTTQQGGGK